MRVELKFTLFECNRDFIELRNGVKTNSPLLGKYCGNTAPPAIYADSGSVRIAFTANANWPFGTFNASFAAVPALHGGISCQYWQF